jgi:ATP-dependent RNA helicase DeaD
MQRFRENNLQLLVATDVAARGLDVSNISHVINYGLPDETEAYTHRSGRTGRAGKTGISISIVTPKYEEKIRIIERKTKAVFAKLPIPTGYEVCEKQLFHIVQGIHTQEVKHAEIEPFLPRIYEELKDLTKEELIDRFASVEFNRFLSYYRNAPDINIYPKGDKRSVRPQTSGTGGGASGQMQRLFLNVGEMDGVTKKDFIKLLNRTFNLPSAAIGHIDLNKAYMHFDIDGAYSAVVRQGLSEFTINGRRIRVDDASAPKAQPGREEKSFDKWNKKKRK